MPTKRSRLSRIVSVLLFIFIAGASVGESEQLISRSSPGESLCLRRCRLRGVKRSGREVLRLSCFHRCIDKDTKGKDRQDLTAKVIKQRIRKALKPHSECGLPSPNQTVDWSPSEVNVTFGQYENTSHWYVNVSWTSMNDSIDNWTDILVRLLVPPQFKQENEIIKPITCSIHPKNQTFLNINISSYHYKYPRPIFLEVHAFPYSPKKAIADITRYDPHIPTSSPSTVQSSNCSLEEYGDLEWYPSNVDARFFQRSNGEWFANISWTPLTNSTVTWTGYFLTLFFGGVSKQKGYGTPKCFKLPKYKTSYIVNSTHGWKYPQSISVSVSAYPFPKRTNQDMHIFYPTHPPMEATVASASETTPRTTDVIPTVFGTAVGVFALLTAVVLARLYCRRRTIAVATQRRTCFKYHVFIIYSMADCSDFVDNVLVPTLDRHYFKYCIHWKDFVPGETVTKNIVESVKNSFKIVAVVSRNFFTSNPCQYELNVAEHRRLNNGDDCLILFKFDDVEIPSTLLNMSYIDFTSATDRSTWERKLVDVLKTAEIVEDESVLSEGDASNNNAPASTSTDNDGVELMCSCQSE